MKGFTLIETFVAIAILATALAGAISLAAQGFNSADIAGDQITAAFLAQDAMEYVRYARDTNCLQNSSVGQCAFWLTTGSQNATDLSPCVDSLPPANPNRKKCYFDTTNQSPRNPALCPSAGCAPLSYSSDTGFYSYSGNAAPSKFTRTVSLQTPICAPTGCSSSEAQVTVLVDWSSRGSPHEVKLQENLFNWEP